MDGFQRHFDSQLLAYGKQTILNLVKTLTGPHLLTVRQKAALGHSHAMLGKGPSSCDCSEGGLMPGQAAPKQQFSFNCVSSRVTVRAATRLLVHSGVALPLSSFFRQRFLGSFNTTFHAFKHASLFNLHLRLENNF